MKRRDFLTAASTCLLPLTINGFSLRAGGKPLTWLQSVPDATNFSDRVLVIIQLNGGNDGLNTVIPLDQLSAYTALRGNIAIPENRVLPLIGNSTVGLHPALTGLRGLYNDGKLSIIHSVGYPDPNQSHDRSTEIWMTALGANQIAQTGWIGRYLDVRFPGYPANYPNPQMKDPLAIQIGLQTSPALLGSQQSMGVAINDPNAVYQMTGSASTTSPTGLPCCNGGALISFVRQQQKLATGYAAEIKRAAGAGRNLGAYPPSTDKNELAEQLKIVARLIHGGMQTKIYFVRMDGFDTHAGQVDNADSTKGRHADLLSKLSAAITSFQQDLKLQGLEDKVIGMTFSEFGRRANSNASKGTDHGVAAPLFVFGSSVRHPAIGVVPDLSALSGTGANRDVPMQIDFRRVYSDIINDWFGTDPTTTNAILYRSFPTTSLFSDSIETVASGNWTDASTWSVGRMPLANERVRINFGHTITAGQTVMAKNIQLQGKLQFTGNHSVVITG
ncbi:DUF1501 domain-containing protein [Spirosoma arcticum]